MSDSIRHLGQISKTGIDGTMIKRVMPSEDVPEFVIDDKAVDRKAKQRVREQTPLPPLNHNGTVEIFHVSRDVKRFDGVYIDLKRYKAQEIYAGCIGALKNGVEVKAVVLEFKDKTLEIELEQFAEITREDNANGNGNMR